MEYGLFMVFALVSYSACQERSSSVERIRSKIRSSGPNVTIEISWHAGLCSRGHSPQYYIIKFCSDQNECTTSYGDNRLKESFEHNKPVPIAFFNTYTVHISYPCSPEEYTELGRREIFSGAGEFMPPRGVTAKAGNRSVTLIWQKPNERISVFGDYVEITVCRLLSGDCLERHYQRYGSTPGRYTITQLSEGVEYIAKISVYEEHYGTTYRSKPVSVPFATDPPGGKVYRPVDDFSVKVLKKSNDVNLRLSYSKPKSPSGANFIGVRIDIIDKANVSVVEGLRSNDTKVVVENLPYFAHFTVKVRALYEDGDDVIESMEVTELVGTGTDVLPDKPRILEVTSISNSSALIRWSHNAHKSVEFSYRITLNEGVTLDIEKLDANYAVIDKSLKPDVLYNLKFSVILSYHGETTELSSELKLFKMLPADALVAKYTVEDIQGSYMDVKWDVTLPKGASECYVTVNHCLDGKTCTRTIISDMTDKMVHLEIEPFERYNITMNTTCMFVPDIVVFGVSETINYVAASRPPAVFKLLGDSPDEHTLNIFWAPGPPYTRGYRVNYSVASENSWKQLNTSTPSCVISDLEPSTSYNVSVLAYSMNGDEELWGPPTSSLFRTPTEAPPEVKDLIVSQVGPFTRTIRVGWTAPPYDKGTLSFKVTTKCRTTLELWTNDTNLEFKSEEAPDPSTRCDVWVQAVNLGFDEPAYSGKAHAELTLETLPPPVRAEAVFLADGKYLIRITPPKVEGVNDFDYQASPGQEFVDRYRRNEIMVEEERFDLEVNYAVRVCVNDLCGQSLTLTFTTNTGPPDRVNSMSLELIDDTSIEILWAKPERQNGPIDGYFVNITERGDQGQVVSSQEEPSETSFIFDGSEYTTYDVSVQAFNCDKFDRAVLKLGKPEVNWIETEGIVPRPPSAVSSSIVQGEKVIRWETDKKFNVARHKITATEVATQNQTILYTTKPVFELSVLKPYTQHVFRIASCIDAAGYVCGQPTTFEETTDVGHPSAVNVQLVNQNSTHVLFRWSEPEEKRGPVNGYEFAYIKTADGPNPSDWVSAENDRSAVIALSGENSVYIVHVRAYNIDFGNKKLYSPAAVLEFTTQGRKGDASIAVVAASVSLCVVGLATLAYFGYKKFSRTVYAIP